MTGLNEKKLAILSLFLNDFFLGWEFWIKVYKNLHFKYVNLRVCPENFFVMKTICIWTNSCYYLAYPVGSSHVSK